jgi:hypothetical protein
VVSAAGWNQVSMTVSGVRRCLAGEPCCDVARSGWVHGNRTPVSWASLSSRSALELFATCSGPLVSFVYPDAPPPHICGRQGRSGA